MPNVKAVLAVLARSAFLRAGGRPERADAAVKLLGDRLELAGDQLAVKNAAGVAIDGGKFFTGFRQEMPEWYAGTKASGGGAAGGAGHSHGGRSVAEMAELERLLLTNPEAVYRAALEAEA